MSCEFAFEMSSSSIRFGKGVTREIGVVLAEMKTKMAMVLTDSTLSGLPPVAKVQESLTDNKINFILFDRVRVEPTDESFKEAIKFAANWRFDAFVAVGGGSTIDTAKVASLYSTFPPSDFLDYVNPPIGKGLPVPGSVKPVIAIPTTAGTGSETTGGAIFDLVRMHAKTGIAHRQLKPALGILDPENTQTLPPQIAASTGLDVLSHAIESYTAIPFSQRPVPKGPYLRPVYQGSNPISDLWSMEALNLVSKYLHRVVGDSSDEEARAKMLLASSYAGMGFGNAGVHLPHGMSYPVSGMVRNFRPEGYVVDHPLIPHGISVILNTPAVVRFTGQACPERHLKVAEVLGASISKKNPADAGKILADQITKFMYQLNVPNGLKALGYGVGDIPRLVEGTLPQHRVTKLSPRPANQEDLASLFEDAFVAW